MEFIIVFAIALLIFLAGIFFAVAVSMKKMKIKHKITQTICFVL